MSVYVPASSPVLSLEPSGLIYPLSLSGILKLIVSCPTNVLDSSIAALNVHVFTDVKHIPSPFNTSLWSPVESTTNVLANTLLLKRNRKNRVTGM